MSRHGIANKMMAAVAVCALALTALAGPVQAEAKYKWKLTTFVPENSGTYRDFVKVFIKYVHEITDGEVEIKGFGVGVLANAFEGPKAVQDGVADIAFFYPAFLVNKDPANAIFTGMPGGFRRKRCSIGSMRAVVKSFGSISGAKPWVCIRLSAALARPTFS